MPFAQFRFFLLLLSLTLLCATAPAFASFNGAIDFGFEGSFVIAAVIMLPSALLCGGAELVGVHYRPPLWSGGCAVGVSLGVLAIFLGVLEYSPLAKASQAIFSFLGDRAVFLYSTLLVCVYFLPALISLALVTFLTAARWRLIATWSIALGVGYAIVFKAGHKSYLGSSAGLVGALFGGVSVSMLMWQVAFILGQRQLRSRSIP